MDAIAVASVGGDSGLPTGRGWVLIGSAYSVDAKAGSLDEHLKRFLKRATAGWVAAHYRIRYGETPSTTLRHDASTPQPDDLPRHSAWAVPQKEELIQ